MSQNNLNVMIFVLGRNFGNFLKFEFVCNFSDLTPFVIDGKGVIFHVF
jgi:hypothetical protein